jgi:hypothetical protein
MFLFDSRTLVILNLRDTGEYKMIIKNLIKKINVYILINFFYILLYYIF